MYHTVGRKNKNTMLLVLVYDIYYWNADLENEEFYEEIIP
jgi:hypothetical protein